MSLRVILALFLVFISVPAVAMERQTLTITTPAGAVHSFTVEVAVTADELREGLMGRTELAPDAGMLFLQPEVAPMGMWMKNTLIPLDMVFIRPDLTVSGIFAHAKPGDLTPVLSGEPVTAALEIPGGQAAALGIVPGSRVEAKALLVN